MPDLPTDAERSACVGKQRALRASMGLGGVDADVPGDPFQAGPSESTHRYFR